jgi:hypothetical protein
MLACQLALPFAQRRQSRIEALRRALTKDLTQDDAVR